MDYKIVAYKAKVGDVITLKDNTVTVGAVVLAEGSPIHDQLYILVLDPIVVEKKDEEGNNGD